MALIVADRIAETSSTAGTGAFTLSGALTGFKRFSSACAIGDTCYYLIEAVNTVGAPTGQWESGLGTYSADNTLTRTTVTASSTGAKVSFSGGTKRVMISATSAYISSLSRLTVETVSDAAYTFTADDAGKHLRFNTLEACIATVPAGVFVSGQRIRITTFGTEGFTLAAGAGTTLNSRDGALSAAGQYSVIEIECVGGDKFDVLGDVA